MTTRDDIHAPREGDTMSLTVRYFAGAAQAAGTDTETLEMPVGSSLAAVGEVLAHHRPDLARVLQVSTWLINGAAATDRDAELPASAVLDILPPFAGG